MQDKKSVLVFMATYNGEKYLETQINSILQQKDVDVYILVSDDKSSDSTSEILERYAQKYDKFKYVINKENKGFTYNFLDCIYSAKNEYDYYALADQDDYWEEDKLISAINKIEKLGSDRGTLYCSNLTLADENLKPFGMQENKKILKANKFNFIVGNIATGCTIVFDAKLFSKILSYYPQGIYLHDYWLFLIAVFTGDYIYDFNSHILYRQHGSNQIGSNKKIFTRKKISQFFRNSYSQTIILKDLLKGYRDMISEEDIKYLQIAANYKDNFATTLRLVFSRKIRRRLLNFLFKVKVLLRKF